MKPKDKVLLAYDLTQDNVELERIQAGLINSTWCIKCGYNIFILQKINHTIFKSPECIASNIRMIDDYLKRNHPSYLFISPLKTRDNQEILKVPGSGFFCLYPFVSNSHTIDTVKKRQLAFEAAKMFGEFTKLLINFPVEQLRITIPDFHNLTLRYEQFCEALRHADAISFDTINRTYSTGKR